MNILGIDIDPNCRKFEENGIHIEIGSQEDPEFWHYIKNTYPPFDILIDDGGHTMKQQIVTFNEVFPSIKDGGLYLCEDLHTSYWQNYGGGYQAGESFIEYTKNLIDLMNSKWMGYCFLNATELAEHIMAIHYYDSMVVLEKGKRKLPPFSLEYGCED